MASFCVGSRCWDVVSLEVKGTIGVRRIDVGSMHLPSFQGESAIFTAKLQQSIYAYNNDFFPDQRTHTSYVGTSSKSTKLVHGGVRYLQKAVFEADYEQYKLVREALHERKTFLHIAPYLSNPLPIMLPIYKSVSSFFHSRTMEY